MVARREWHPLGMLLGVGLTFVSITARADETCGLPSTFDVIFINGFEAASPAALPLPTLAQLEQNRRARQATAPTIAITSPASGAAIADSKVDVVGTYSGPDNTGIAIGSARAYTYNGQFVVPALPLAPGSTTLTATATTIDGLTSSASATVSSAQAAPAPLSLAANAYAGFAPLAVSFVAQLNAGSIQSVAVDYDGDGVDDYSGAAFPSPFAHTYSTPGIYAVRLTVHSSAGTTYTATQRVVIQDLAAVRSTVCGVFGHFRQNVAANQMTTAAQALGDTAKDRYTTFLNGLGATNAGTVATQLGTIANGVFGVDQASLIVVANVGSETVGFPVTIARGDDGVWRIISL